MPIEINFNFISAIILIGIFLGSILSFFLIKKSWQEKLPNIFLGLFILSTTLIMLEGWLNYTLIVLKAPHFANFSEPFNFAIAPLIYLFMLKELGDPLRKSDWWHAIPFAIWLGYCFFFFLQPLDIKFNSVIEVMNLDLGMMRPVNEPFSSDPMGIRRIVNELTIIHILIYLLFTISLLMRRARELGQSLFNTTDTTIKSLRNGLGHFVCLFLILVTIKAIFKNDVGDYLLFLYFSFMLFMTTYHIINSSSYFNSPSAFLEAPTLKYQSSNLDETDKMEILNAITVIIDKKEYCLNSDASLSGLAKLAGHSSHNVSQVINEKIGKSFFEVMAAKRVEAAKNILRSKEGNKLTIEEISERVGYNSKSAFNSVFKKLTSITPSAYRDS